MASKQADLAGSGLTEKQASEDLAQLGEAMIAVENLFGSPPLHALRAATAPHRASQLKHLANRLTPIIRQIKTLS